MPHDPRIESPEAPLPESWFYAEGNRLLVRRSVEAELAFAELELGPVSDVHDPRVESDEEEERWQVLPHTD